VPAGAAGLHHLNTLLIQDVLADGLVELTDEDRRGITPLFWSHISPYGEVKVDMTRRISLLADTGTTDDGDSGSPRPPAT